MSVTSKRVGNPPSTILSIQYLRAFAAFLVLCWHIRTKSAQVGANLFSGFDFGFAGVDVFFVISGFVMCFIYMRSPGGPRALASFWLRRFLRIIPLYWLLTCIALAVFLVAPDKVNSGGGTTSVWKSFLLVPGQDKFLIENGWTLSYEMYFYALFSVAFLARRKAFGALAICGSIGVLVAGGLTGVLPAGFLTSPRLAEFAVGIVIYLLYLRWSDSRLTTTGALCAIAGFGGIVLLRVGAAVLPGLAFLTIGVPAALVVLGVTLNEHVVRRYPARWLAALGDSSYSMYLSHPFVLAGAGLVFRKVHLVTHGVAIEAGWWTAAAIAAMFVGYWVFRFIETPLIHWLYAPGGRRRNVVSVRERVG